MGNRRQRRALNYWQKQTVRTLFEGGHYSRAGTKSQAEANCADIIRGRALNHWQKQTVRTLFEGGYRSRAETIRGNTVPQIISTDFLSKINGPSAGGHLTYSV